MPKERESEGEVLPKKEVKGIILSKERKSEKMLLSKERESTGSL